MLLKSCLLVQKTSITLTLVDLFEKLSMTQTKQSENNIPDTSGLITKTDYNAKIT